MGRPPLSIVIPTRDRPQQLDACLATIAPELGPNDEVLVVDSASADPAAIAAVAAAAGVGYVCAPRNGTSLARNVGLRTARYDLIAFLDDDVRVEAGWADAMVAALQQPDTQWVTGRVGMTDADAAHVDIPVAVKVDSDPQHFDGTSVEHPGHSANLALHRAAGLQVGGFDEYLGPGRPLKAGEDVDLYDRLLAAGLHGRYEPAASVTHEQWRSRRERVRLEWCYGLGTGARMAKLVRLDRRRSRMVLRVLLVDWGVVNLWRDLRAWREFAVVVDLMRLAGMAAGFARAVTIPLRDAHFAPRRGHTRH